MDTTLSLIEFWFLLVVVVASGIASILNGVIREITESGKTAPGWLLKVSAVVNFLAVNLDKARQLWKGYRGPSTPPAGK